MRLPISPHPHLMADHVGLEPTTYRLTADCSNHLSYWSIMVRKVGFEPTTSWFQITSSTKLSYILMMAVIEGNAPSSSRWQRDILTFGRYDHLVGTSRIELELHPYQGCVLTVILCSYLTAGANDLTDHTN